MSSSPKYTIIDLAAERSAAERAAAARRAAARRERQRQRDEEFRRLRAARAEQAAEGERGLVAERLAAVSAIITELSAPGGADAGEVSALLGQVAALRAAAGSATGPGLTGCLRDAERLRERALALSTRARGAAGQRATRTAVLTGLRERLAAPGEDAARLDPAGYRRCADLIGELGRAAGEDSVRFEALHGTAEHAIAGYNERGVAAVTAARAARDEAADLLASFGAAARSAAADARELHDDDLAAELETALAGLTAALAAVRDDPGAAGAALRRARDLAALLPRAEARLDELAEAYERRATFAETLKDVLAEHGMSFLRTTETRDRFILEFERPGGALYTAAVDDGENDELMLSYAIDGEADIPVLPAPGEAVCDQTEEFLEAIHAELEPDGYHAGELLWEGKSASPRTSRARQLGAASRPQRTLQEPR